MAFIEALKKKYWARTSAASKPPVPILENAGYCPICAHEVTFAAYRPWLRDRYLCSHCGSVPRERALMLTIETYFPNWRSLIIHESSPGSGKASKRLAQECAHYIPSQF